MPHKQLCGQKLDEETLNGIERPTHNAWENMYDSTLAEYNMDKKTEAVIKARLLEMTFPEPVPGFKRSIALQLQIKVLHEDLDAHYMVPFTFLRFARPD